MLDYDGKRHTSPACSTNGAYTMHVNGANHTPRISQFQTAFAVSSGAQTIHPNPSAIYAMYLMKCVNAPDEDMGDGEARVRGSPRRTASVAAREKLRTDVMDITVEARHRFNDFTRLESGAVVGEGAGEVARTAPSGTAETTKSSSGESTWWCVRCQCYINLTFENVPSNIQRRTVLLSPKITTAPGCV
jgi:hypothetical protein